MESLLASPWKKEPTSDTAEGVALQQLCKMCPGFAVEAAAIGVRVLRSHWGPLNSRAAEIRPEAEALLQKVEAIVDGAVA